MNATYWHYAVTRYPEDTTGFKFHGKFGHARYQAYNVYNDDTKVELPTLAAQRDTSYNGLDALRDGTLIAKTVYREAGCEEQGFSAFLNCPNSNCVPNSLVVAIDPRNLEVVGGVEAPEFIGERLTTTRFQGKDYVYLAGTTTAFRYLL